MVLWFVCYRIVFYFGLVRSVMLVFGFFVVELNIDYMVFLNVSVSGIFLVGYKFKVFLCIVDMFFVIWVEYWLKDLELFWCWWNFGNLFWRVVYWGLGIRIENGSIRKVVLMELGNKGRNIELSEFLDLWDLDFGLRCVELESGELYLLIFFIWGIWMWIRIDLVYFLLYCCGFMELMSRSMFI